MSRRDTYLLESAALAADDDVYGEKVPPAVELLISYLEHAGLGTPELFAGDPSVREINDVIDALRDGHFTDVAAATRGSTRLAASALAAYIRQLPQPLLAPPHYEALCAAMEADSYGERIASVRDRVAEMPESHQSVLHRLFHFLARLAERSTAPGNTAEALVAFWVGMIAPLHERGRGLMRNEYRLVGLMLQQHACIFEGSLDAFEVPELPLPPHLSHVHQRAKGGWQRIKASLLRDSHGQFKIQVREDECGIYLDVIAPTDVSDDRNKLAERDYLVSLQRQKVEELTLTEVRNMIRDAGSIIEMEVRRYVTEASEAARAEQAARAERERREQAQLERYQQSVQQYIEQPHNNPLQSQHIVHTAPQPALPQPHRPPQQPASVRYAQRQTLSLDKLPMAVPPRQELDLWVRHEASTAPVAPSQSPSADLLGLDLDLLTGPPLTAPSPTSIISPRAASATRPPSAAYTFLAGETAVYRGQTITVVAVHKDDPAGDYFTIRMANGSTRDVEGPLQPLVGSPGACSEPEALASVFGSNKSLDASQIGTSSSTGSLQGNHMNIGVPSSQPLSSAIASADGPTALFPPSAADPFSTCALTSNLATWAPSSRDSVSSCGSAPGHRPGGAVAPPPSSLLDANLFGPNTPIVSSRCPPPPPPVPIGTASAPSATFPSNAGCALKPAPTSTPAIASASPSNRTSNASSAASAVAPLSASDPFGDRSQSSWVPFGSSDSAPAASTETSTSVPPFRNNPPPPPAGAPPTSRAAIRQQHEKKEAETAAAARVAEAARAEQERQAREVAKKASEEREKRRELEKLEGIARRAEEAARQAEAAKQEEMGKLAGLSREEKRARIRSYIEKEQRLKREAADAAEAAKREAERLEAEEAERRAAEERAAREAAEAARLEEIRRKVREKLAAEKAAKAAEEERRRIEEEQRKAEEQRRKEEAEARARKEAEVRAALRAAIERDEIHMLEQALRLSEKEDVELEETLAASTRLKELQEIQMKREAERIRAAAALQAAMASGELELLRSTLDAASEACVDEDLVSLGEAKLIEIEERIAAEERAKALAEARERERAEALAQLDAAVKDGDDADNEIAQAAAMRSLEEALLRAEAAGVPSHPLWMARQARNRLREEAERREAAREAAREALHDAICSCEITRIPALIDDAERAGVDVSELDQARRDLASLEREEAERRRADAVLQLERAIAEGSLETIGATVDAAATLGVSSEELAPAYERMEEIRAERAAAERERAAASAALEELLRSEQVDAEAMREAMSRAIKAAVDDSVLSRGRERQAVLEEEEALRLEAEELARFKAEEAERLEREKAEAEEAERLAAIEAERDAAEAAAEAARIEEEERLAALEKARESIEENLRLEAEAEDEAILTAAEEARIEEEERLRLEEEARLEEEIRAGIEAEAEVAEAARREAEEAEAARQSQKAAVARRAAQDAEVAHREAEAVAVAESEAHIQTVRATKSQVTGARFGRGTLKETDRQVHDVHEAQQAPLEQPSPASIATIEEDDDDDIAPPSEPYSGDESTRLSDVLDAEDNCGEEASDEDDMQTPLPPSRGDSISSVEELSPGAANLKLANGAFVDHSTAPAPTFEASFERHFDPTDVSDAPPSHSALADSTNQQAACSTCGHPGSAQGAAEAAFAQLQALCEESQAAQAAMLVCCQVYREELNEVEEEAEHASQQGVVNAQNLRIQQLKSQVRQQAAAMRDLAAELELRDAGEGAPAVAERIDRQANQRIERYRTENEKLEEQLVAMRQALAAARSQNEVLQQQLNDAIYASKRTSIPTA